MLGRRPLALAVAGSCLLLVGVFVLARQPASAGSRTHRDELLARAVAADPASAADAWLDLEDYCLQENDVDGALRAVEDGLLHLQGQAPARSVAALRMERGRLLVDAGRAGDATADLLAARPVLVDEGLQGAAVACGINLAAAWSNSGEVALAHHELQRAVADCRVPGLARLLPQALANLADVERRLGQHQSAVAHAREVLALVQQSAAPALSVELARADLGRTLFSQGAAANDTECCREGEESLRTAARRIDEGHLLPQGHADRLRIEQNLSACCWRRGALAEAVARSANAVEHLAPTDAERSKALFGHGSLLTSTGHLQEARSYMLQAVAEASSRLTTACTTASERAVLARHLELRSLLSSVLSCRDFDAAPDRPELDRQDAAVWLLGRGFSEWRNRRALCAAALSASDPGFAAEWQALHRLDAAPAAPDPAAAPTADSTAADDVARALRRAERDRREAALARRLAVASAADSLDLTAATRLLPADSVALVTATYLRTAKAREGGTAPASVEHVAAFLLRPDGSARRFELGPAAAIATAVERARAELQLGAQAGALPQRGRDPDKGVGPTGGPDIGALLQPVVAAIDNDVRRLIVCPDGALTALPWAAVAVAPDRRLGDRLAVTFVDHPASLAAPPLAAGAESLLVLGDVDYGAPPAQDPTRERRVWNPLPGTQREVERCLERFRAAFPGAATFDLQRGRASWSQLASSVPGRRYLHLATHGFVAAESAWPRPADPMAPAGAVLETDPLELTGLALAGANTDRGDGVVSAARIAGLDLSACGLAVLACCDSNVGPRAFGEALSGLHAAVRAAGARAVISALWQIPDEQSVRFFDLFYAALWSQGLPPDAAFLQAQRQAREQGLSPQCWAAFAYYGPVSG